VRTEGAFQALQAPTHLEEQVEDRQIPRAAATAATQQLQAIFPDAPD